MAAGVLLRRSSLPFVHRGELRDLPPEIAGLYAAARHEANAPILTPHIPAMIAAATTMLIATHIIQRRSALRRSTPCAISTTLRPDAMWLRMKKTPSA